MPIAPLPCCCLQRRRRQLRVIRTNPRGHGNSLRWIGACAGSRDPASSLPAAVGLRGRPHCRRSWPFSGRLGISTIICSGGAMGVIYSDLLDDAFRAIVVHPWVHTIAAYLSDRNAAPKPNALTEANEVAEWINHSGLKRSPWRGFDSDSLSRRSRCERHGHPSSSRGAELRDCHHHGARSDAG